MASACARVVGSATVGPEATSSGSSPGTSDITRLTTRAGLHASASRPPLMADRWRRTQFISPMLAPLRSRAWLSARLSASVMPGRGKGSSAEPPPDHRPITRSSAVRLSTAFNICCAAVRPAASGTGWAASSTRTCWQAAACPYRVTTTPDSGAGQWASSTCAICADALPAPITTVRPRGGAGRCGGRHTAGWAEAMAASNMLRSQWRAWVSMCGVIGWWSRAQGVGTTRLRRLFAAVRCRSARTRRRSPALWWLCRPGRGCVGPGWP